MKLDFNLGDKFSSFIENLHDVDLSVEQSGDSLNEGPNCRT